MSISIIICCILVFLAGIIFLFFVYLVFILFKKIIMKKNINIGIDNQEDSFTLKIYLYFIIVFLITTLCYGFYYGYNYPFEIINS